MNKQRKREVYQRRLMSLCPPGIGEYDGPGMVMSVFFARCRQLRCRLLQVRLWNAITFRPLRDAVVGREVTVLKMKRLCVDDVCLEVRPCLPSVPSMLRREGKCAPKGRRAWPEGKVAGAGIGSQHLGYVPEPGQDLFLLEIFITVRSVGRPLSASTKEIAATMRTIITAIGIVVVFKEAIISDLTWL